MTAPGTAGEIKGRLERKATFEAATRELAAALAQRPAGQHDDLLPLVHRTHALLKARYTNPAFWSAGAQLYRALQALPPLAGDEQLQAKLRSYLADVAAVLRTDAEEGPEAQRQQTLGELLLGLPPPQDTPSHLSDGGLVLDHHLPPRLQPGAAAAAGAEQQAAVDVEELLRRLQQHNAREQQGAAGEQQQQQQQGAAGERQQQQQLDEALLLETLAGQLPRAELEALLEGLTEQAAAHQAPQRPPASKRAVASLPLLDLGTEADLERVGGPGTCCAVCLHELKLGDCVQQLPCPGARHVFHVSCLAPWLEQNNSCPTCRHELPTDDHAYEARKEQLAEEEEERRGAAAALSHNEFQYI